jgi:hypothetical protein
LVREVTSSKDIEVYPMVEVLRTAYCVLRTACYVIVFQWLVSSGKAYHP